MSHRRTQHRTAAQHRTESRHRHDLHAPVRILLGQRIEQPRHTIHRTVTRRHNRDILPLVRQPQRFTAARLLGMHARHQKPLLRKLRLEKLHIGLVADDHIDPRQHLPCLHRLIALIAGTEPDRIHRAAILSTHHAILHQVFSSERYICRMFSWYPATPCFRISTAVVFSSESCKWSSIFIRRASIGFRDCAER